MSVASGSASERELRFQQVAAEYLEAREAGRADELSALLARHPDLADEIAAFVAEQDEVACLAAPLRQAVAPAGEVLPLALPGDHGRLGDFRIIREVGRGGMGVVYEAEQVSLGRRVALKVLPFAATMDPRQMQRFHNEARAAAGLHHTNIVPVYGVGCERGVHYYAMQFIDGRTLADLIAQQRGGPPSQVPTVAEAEGVASATTVPPAAQATSAAPRDAAYFRRVAEWGIQAAEALDCAHSLGVVHRDVKPANLLVDGSGRLWVTDFGLAQVQSDARLTVTGDLVGTLRYMSPEQALAKRVVIDHRTDVYSLGATLYELLTLEPAFRGSDRQELLRQIAFEEPRPLRRVNKTIPAELEAIVLKALERNPADRYATAKELADDLRRWQDGRLIQARRPTLVQRAQKWLRRHPAVVRSAMLMVLLAAMASATGGWLLWQEQRKTQRALDGETRQRKAAERVTEILGSVFRDLDPQAEEKGGPALRVQLGERLDEAARLLQGSEVGDSLTVANLQFWLGKGLQGLGQYEKALPLLEQARQTTEAALGADHLDTLACKNNLATLYKDQAKYDQAEALFQEVLQGWTAQLGANDPLTLICKHNLADLYEAQGKYDRAEALYKAVLQARTARLEADHPDTLNTKNNLAMLYVIQGKYDRAEPLLKEALQAKTAKLGADHPLTLKTKGNLAFLYHEQGQYGRAEVLYKEVLQGQIARLGADHPDTLENKGNLGALYLHQDKLEQAEALLRDVLQGHTAKLGQDHPETLASKANLAALYYRMHKLDRSIPLFEEVVRGGKAKLGADHSNTFLSIFNLAVNYGAAGRLNEAVALLDESLPRALTVLPPGSPAREFGLTDGVATYLRAARHDKAERLLRDLADVVKQHAGAEPAPYTRQLRILGLFLLQQEKYPEAEKVLRECLAIREKTKPDDWSTFNARSMLGGALLGQGKYAEAEPLLLQGYDGLKQREHKITPSGKVRLPEAMERLVQLYDAWGKKDQADRWRKELDAARAKP